MDDQDDWVPICWTLTLELERMVVQIPLPVITRLCTPLL